MLVYSMYNVFKSAWPITIILNSYVYIYFFTCMHMHIYLLYFTLYLITGKSPVIYTGLSPGRYCLTVQAACPNQSYQKGPKNSKKIRFMVSIKP